MAISPSKRKSISHEAQTPKKQKNVDNKPKTPKSVKKNNAPQEKLIKFPGTGKPKKEQPKSESENEKEQTPKIYTPKVPVNLKDIEAIVDKEIKEIGNGKMRFLLFLKNLPFDASPEEIKNHFEKDGINVKTVRIPKGKQKYKRPTGYGYLELVDKNSYIKALSMRKTYIKGRLVNIMYTSTSRRNSANRREIVKETNKKLNALWVKDTKEEEEAN